MNEVRAEASWGWTRWLAVGATLVACGGDGDEPGTEDGGSNTTGNGGGNGNTNTGGADAGGNGAGSAYEYSACPEAEHVGGFRVMLNEGGGFSSVEGQVRDGIVPSNIPEPVSSEGDCTLVQGRALFCDPACSSDETCGEDGTCVPHPASQDLGTVDVTGLKDEVSIEPFAPAFAYSNRGTLTHPAFDEGASVQLSAEGGTLSPFTLAAEGVAPLDLGEDLTIEVKDGSPVELSWTPPAETGKSRVLVTLNISLHGGDPVRIECDADDTGSLTIPANLISELLSYAYSGFPAVDITRQTVDSMDTSLGCIDLAVGAAHTRVPVEIEGEVSCNDDDDCPQGESCGNELLCE